MRMRVKILCPRETDNCSNQFQKVSRHLNVCENLAFKAWKTNVKCSEFISCKTVQRYDLPLLSADELSG